MNNNKIDIKTFSILCDVSVDVTHRWLNKETWKHKRIPKPDLNGLYDEDECRLFAQYIRTNIHKKRKETTKQMECKCPFCEKVFTAAVPAGSFPSFARYARIYCKEHSYIRSEPDCEISKVRAGEEHIKLQRW